MDYFYTPNNMRVVNPQNKTFSYAAIAFALVSLTIIAFLTIQGIFSALRGAGEIDDSLLQSSTPRINVEVLDRVYGSLSTKTVPALD
jgi:hypothetical protein